MDRVMLMVELDDEDASLTKVQKKLKASPGEIDHGFGLVNIDPERKLYTLLVDEGLASRVRGKSWVKGPFANPTIEPAGPAPSPGES